MQSRSKTAMFALSVTLVVASIGFPGLPSRAIGVAAATGSWSYTANSLRVSRYSFRATTLSSGALLVEGGFAPGAYTAESELYTPATNTWTPTGSLNRGRGEHSATLLPTGKVLVAGGYAGPVLNSAELYDPASGTWAATGSMEQVRTRHSATLLPTGKVLVAGGWMGDMIAGAELYDPASGSWSSAGAMATTRADHLAILLANGKVLVMGGAPTNGGHTAETELYDPQTNQWTVKASMKVARAGLAGVPLKDGRVLVTGGTTDAGITGASELYDPAKDQWTSTGGMHVGRFSALGDGAVLLDDGTVLVAGGGGDTQGTSEIYHPASGTWGSLGAMQQPQCDHATAKLRDGRVLIAAGYDCGGTALAPAVAQVYNPQVSPVTVSPTITGVSPANGPVAGGTDVTVVGTGFAPGTIVKFGGVKATTVDVAGDGTAITATTAAHRAGTVNVVITNPNGRSAILGDTFTFEKPAAVPQPLLIYVPGIMGKDIPCVSAKARATETFGDIFGALAARHYHGIPYAFDYGQGYTSCGRGDGWYGWDENHQSLLQSASQLDKQIRQQVAKHGVPSRLDVLTHSQGGAVALLWVNNYQSTFFNDFKVPANVFTLDSPIMGCTSVPCAAFTGLQVPSVLDMNKCDIKNQERAARGTDTNLPCDTGTIFYAGATHVAVYATANRRDGVVLRDDAFPPDLAPGGAVWPANNHVMDINDCTMPTHPFVKDIYELCHGSVLVNSQVAGWIADILAPAVPPSS